MIAPSRCLLLAAAFLPVSVLLAKPPVDSPEEARARIAEELSQPFSYYSVPSDVLGFKDCPEGTQVTGDGAFLTAYGELDLYVGAPPQRVNQRIRTLEKGYLPILQYNAGGQDGAGVRYTVRAFGAPIDLDPRGDLINFVRIEVHNAGTQAATATVGTAFAPRADDRSRCDRMGAEDWYRDKYLDAGRYDPEAEITVRDGTAWRAGHFMFACQPPEGARSRVERAPDTNAVMLVTELEVAPGASQSIDITLPYIPIDAERAEVLATVRQMRFDDYSQRVASFWDDLLARGMLVDTAEDKVNGAMRASLIYDLIARDITEDGQHFVQKCNEFNYDSFYPRDTSYFVRTYEMLGHPKIARETLDYFISYDEQGHVDGLKRLAPDDWGQSLWAVAQYYRATGDLDFARHVYPAIPPHVAGLEEALASDPDGLWPVAGRYDNEMVDGHYTGHNFWALLGLREAITMAEAVGKPDDAAKFRRIHTAYRKRVMDRLREITSLTGGYIPPGLDSPGDGYDWANASGGVYPFGVLDAQDPMVTATTRLVRENKIQEGLMTWGPNAWVVWQRRRQGLDANPGWLHHYETIYLLDTLVVRGEQRKVLEGFYSFLAHTSSTHAGFEHEIWQWGDRDPGGNYPPHGWCAARFNALLRNMLVREQGDDVHVCSVVSPVWIAPGKTLRVERAATYFGSLSYTLAARDDGATFDLRTDWRTPPARLVFHVPWFTQVTSATADGRPVPVTDGQIVLDPATRRLELSWRRTEDPPLSYDLAVHHYLVKYYLRPKGADYAFLFPTPRPPGFGTAPPLFLNEAEIELVPLTPKGTIHYTFDGSEPGPDSPVYRGPIRITDTTTIKALTVWDNGWISDPVEATFTRGAPRAAVKDPGGLEPGSLRFAYYEGDWRALPDFAAQAPKTTGRTQTFDVNTIKEREDDYAIRYTGYVEIPQDGVYTFCTASDDGSRLTIGDTLVVDNDGEHAMREAIGSVPLARGLHPIAIAFFNKGGYEELRVTYAPAGQPMKPLPFTMLRMPPRD